YFYDLISHLFKYDDYNLQFQIINAHSKDTFYNQLPLATSNYIQNLILKKFIDYSIGTNIPYINSPYNDLNINFLYNLEIANYNINCNRDELNSNILFRTAIALTYGTIPYMSLDSYKIFNQTLIDNNCIILNTSEIQNLKYILLNNIK